MRGPEWFALGVLTGALMMALYVWWRLRRTLRRLRGDE